MNDYISCTLKDYPKNSYVLGHDYVDDLLSQMIKNHLLHNALIFSGPKGIGKATYAINFIKKILSTTIININNGKLAETDDNHIINLVNNNTHPNLLCVTPTYDDKKKEFKSSITVDDSRKIIDFTHLTTIYDSYKIILIDSIDELNHHATSALLKILEEPPKNTLFIIISHNYRSVLETIKSRCINIVFKRLPDDIILQQSNQDTSSIIVDNTIKKTLLKLSQGSLGRYLWLINKNNLFIVQELLQLINQSRSVESIHKFMESISTINNLDINFLLNILYCYLGDCINLSNSIKLSLLMEEINHTKALSEELHLDKKHILYSLLYKIIQL